MRTTRANGIDCISETAAQATSVNILSLLL